MLNFYDRGLQWVLRHQLLTLLPTLALIVLTGYLYIVIPKGFFPEQDTGFIFGESDARQDMSFDGMAALSGRCSTRSRQDPAVSGAVAFVGATGGNATESSGRMIDPAQALRRARPSAPSR